MPYTGKANLSHGNPITAKDYDLVGDVMDAIKDFLMTPGLNKAHFGKLLYPEADKEYQASMLMQFYHKLWGKKRTFSEGELKRMETIIDQWVGDLITKYENIKALSNSLH